MSESLLIAIIGVVGALLSALIGAFGAIAAAERANKQLGCGTIGLAASGGGLIGLLIIGLLAALVVQRLGLTSPPNGPITVPAAQVPTARSQLPPNPPALAQPSSNAPQPIVSGARQELIGLWEYHKTRAPMPQSADTNQVIVANGDIDNSGTCHIRVFGPGEPVTGLGEGTFQLWRVSGTSERLSGNYVFRKRRLSKISIDAR